MDGKDLPICIPNLGGLQIFATKFGGLRILATKSGGWTACHKIWVDCKYLPPNLNGRQKFAYQWVDGKDLQPNVIAIKSEGRQRFAYKIWIPNLCGGKHVKKQSGSTNSCSAEL